MKKLLAIILAVTMLLPVFAVNSFAASGDTNLLLEIGNVNGTLKQSATQDVSKGGDYTFTLSLDAAETISDGSFIGVKTTAGDVSQATALADDTTVTVKSVKIDGNEVSVTASSTVSGGVLDGNNGVVLLFKMGGINKLPDTVTAFTTVEVTVTVDVPASSQPSPGLSYDFSLDTFGTSGWDSSYDKSSKTITFNGAWVGRGWWIDQDGVALTDIESITINLAENTIGCQVVVDYATATGQAFDCPAGTTSVTATFTEDPVYQVYIQCKENIGTIVLDSVSVTPRTPAAEEPDDDVEVVYTNDSGLPSTDCDVNDPWDFVNIVGNLWGRENVVNCTVEKFSEKLAEGADFVMVVSGNTSSTANVVINGVFDAGNAVLTSTDLGDGKYELSVSLADVKAYMDANSITTFDTVCVQTMFNNFKLHEVKFVTPAPQTPSTSIKFTGGRITIPLPEVVNSGESITLHVTGTANGTFRACLSDAASKGSGWNQSNMAFMHNDVDDDITVTATADAGYILFSVANSWDLGGGTTAATEIQIDSVSIVTSSGSTALTFDNVDSSNATGFQVIQNNPAPVTPVTVPGFRGYIYVNEQYHAMFIGKHFIALEHIDNGTGVCPLCHAELAEADPNAEKIVYSVEKTQGQDSEGAELASGVPCIDAQGAENYFRVASNWVGGGAVWNDLASAIKTEGTIMRVTYTGTITALVYQTEAGSYEVIEGFEVADTEDGKKVLTISCADIAAAAPVALSGDFGGWGNFMINYDGDTTLYGIEVVVPAAGGAAAAEDDIVVVE